MAEPKSFATHYESLRKTAQLPPYAQLAIEYDLDAIAPDTTRPAREIAKKVFERTDNFRKILEALLQPEGLAEMQETELLGNRIGNDVTAILRELMRIDRELLLAELDNSEEAYVAFILATHPRWLSLKTRLAPVCARLLECWTKPNGTKDDLRYLG